MSWQDTIQWIMDGESISADVTNRPMQAIHNNTIYLKTSIDNINARLSNDEITIDDHETRISNNETAIHNNETAINNNANGISNNASAISNNSIAIINNNTNITTNANNIFTNTTNIQTNADNINNILLPDYNQRKNNKEVDGEINIYVDDTNGSDSSGCGSSTNPCRSLNYLFSTNSIFNKIYYIHELDSNYGSDVNNNAISHLLLNNVYNYRVKIFLKTTNDYNAGGYILHRYINGYNIQISFAEYGDAGTDYLTKINFPIFKRTTDDVLITCGFNLHGFSYIGFENRLVINGSTDNDVNDLSGTSIIDSSLVTVKNGVGVLSLYKTALFMYNSDLLINDNNAKGIVSFVGEYNDNNGVRLGGILSVNNTAKTPSLIKANGIGEIMVYSIGIDISNGNVLFKSDGINPQNINFGKGRGACYGRGGEYYVGGILSHGDLYTYNSYQNTFYFSGSGSAVDMDTEEYICNPA